MEQSGSLVGRAWRSGRRVGTASLMAGLMLSGGAGAAISAESPSPEPSVTGATTSAEPAAPEPADSVALAYIQCHGDQQYFVDQARGANEAADALGIDLTVQDSGSDPNLAVTQLDTVVAAGAQGVALVACEQAIGPAVIEKARAADIPFLASDVGLTDADGEAAAFVGFDGPGMGTKVGEAAAALYQESGWADDPAKAVRVLNVEWPELSVCKDRTDASNAVFLETVPDFDASQIVNVPYDGTSPKALENTAASITANPEATDWLVWSCNDEGVQGAIRALEGAGFTPEQVIGVGLGAYIACQEWKSGDSMFKAALYISGVDVGQAAVEALNTAVTTGEPLPPETFAKTTIVDPDTWEAEGVPCQ